MAEPDNGVPNASREAVDSYRRQTGGSHHPAPEDIPRKADGAPAWLTRLLDLIGLVALVVAFGIIWVAIMALYPG